MHSIALFLVVSLASTLGTAAANEKAPPSPGVPPWLATFDKVDQTTKTIVLQFMTVHFVTEEFAKQVVVNGETKGVTERSVRPVYETRTRSIPLQSATFKEAGGGAIKPEDLTHRLKPGTAVVVSADGQAIDPIYLKALAKDAIIIVDGSSVQSTAKSAVLFPPSVDFQAPNPNVSNIR